IRRGCRRPASGCSVCGTRTAADRHQVQPCHHGRHPKGKGADKFKELAEKYTGGKVRIEVYPNSTLYKDKEEIEALQLGAVQMLAPSTAKFAPLGAKEFEALDLPFLFANDEEYTRVTSGPVGKWLFQKLESKGLTGLAFWDNGFHMVSANRPLI